MSDSRVRFRRLAAQWTSLAILSTCLAACHTKGSTQPSPSPTVTHISLPGNRVPDESLLPSVSTFPDLDAATIARLDKGAHTLGTGGLQATLQLLHGDGIEVRATSGDPQIVQASAAPVQASLGADQVYAINVGLAQGDTLSTGDLARAIGTEIGATVSPSNFVTALRQDISTAYEMGGTARAWAVTIYDSSPAGESLRTSAVAGTADIPLDELQTVLILQQIIGTSATQINSSAVDNSARNFTPEQSATTGSCTPSSNLTGQTFQNLKGLWGLHMDKVYDWIAEAGGYAGLKHALATMEIISPILDLVMAKAFFHGKLELNPSPLTRTKEAGSQLDPSAYGEESTLTGHFFFKAPPGQWLACLSLWVYLMTGSKLDANPPETTNVANMPVLWRLDENFTAQGENFVDFKQGKDPTHQITGQDGVSTIGLTGTPQPTDKTKFQTSFLRQASASAQVDPSAVSNIGDTIMLTMIGAVAAATANPVTILVKGVLALMNEIGFFHFYLRFPVRDWGGLPSTIDLDLDFPCPSAGPTYPCGSLHATTLVGAPSFQESQASNPPESGCGAEVGDCTYKIDSATATLYRRLGCDAGADPRAIAPPWGGGDSSFRYVRISVGDTNISGATQGAVFVRFEGELDGGQCPPMSISVDDKFTYTLGQTTLRETGSSSNYPGAPTVTLVFHY